jgi:hypothetical protein
MRSHKDQFIIEYERLEMEYPKCSPDELHDLAMEAASDYMAGYADYLHDQYKDEQMEGSYASSSTRGKK